jgi:carbonic anhydrase/acetyltransferase-like protein (isoleucine patch superfamily)
LAFGKLFPLFVKIFLGDLQMSNLLLTFTLQQASVFNMNTSPKYRLLDESIQVTGKTLYRIQALCDFGHVKSGDLGGFVESDANLDQTGDCWISDNAKVFDNARIYENAVVSGQAFVRDHARISGAALVTGNAQVSGNPVIFDQAIVTGRSWIYDSALVCGNAIVSGDVWVSGSARIVGDAWVFSNTRVNGEMQVVQVYEAAQVLGTAIVTGIAKLKGIMSVDSGVLDK